MVFESRVRLLIRVPNGRWSGDRVDMKHSAENIKAIMSEFPLYGDFVSAGPYGSGHINDTYAVAFNQGGTPVRYILQRINHDIFKDPVSLMDNIERVTRHQAEVLRGLPDTSRRAIMVIYAKSGKPLYQDRDGNYWRVYVMIEGAHSHDVLETPSQAYHAARAFGSFQKLLADLPGGRLHETIPKFHDTPSRVAVLKEAVEKDACNRAKSAEKEIEFVLAREGVVSKLIDLNKAGLIPERVTHNDTKLNNVLLDDATGEGLCVIDLDTVMPGLALYDFGDMVRTGTNSAAEDECDLSKVTSNPAMFAALAEGYLSEAAAFLNDKEVEMMPFSGILITLEIGVRFLTDYLQGDVYFKTSRETHNLDRCRTQFKLVESLEAQEEKMARVVVEALGKARVLDAS